MYSIWHQPQNAIGPKKQLWGRDARAVFKKTIQPDIEFNFGLATEWIQDDPFF